MCVRMHACAHCGQLTWPAAGRSPSSAAHCQTRQVAPPVGGANAAQISACDGGPHSGNIVTLS